MRRLASATAPAPSCAVFSRADPMAGSQFELLRRRRFAPFFLTQALGAFNDNVFKNALIILIALQSAFGLSAPDQLPG